MTKDEIMLEVLSITKSLCDLTVDLAGVGNRIPERGYIGTLARFGRLLESLEKLNQEARELHRKMKDSSQRGIPQT